MQNNRNLNKKREQKTSGEQIEEALFLWLAKIRSKSVPLHGLMFLEKAHQIAI